MEYKHDQVFLQILREEKNISNFLDAFFGFLYRCTDFYMESNTEQKLGFLPDVTEELVLNSMYKWKNTAIVLKKTKYLVNNNTINSVDSVTFPNELLTVQNETVILEPSVAQEVEIETCNVPQSINTFSVQLFKTDHISDSYNGAVRENYIWSQTLCDLDILINIPECIKTSKQVRINISSDEIKIDGKIFTSTKDSDWDNIFNGKLSFKIRKDESVWSIISGKHISIHLEKASERWWEALIIGESKIELSKIDCSKNFDDMAVAEQMKIEELIWNHQQKLLGKPTSEQIKMENILKQAWNAKGSPLQGRPYDPSILRYN